MWPSFHDELEKIAQAIGPPPPVQPPKPKKSIGGMVAKGLLGVAALGAGAGLARGFLGRTARGLRAARKFGVTSPSAIPRSQSSAVNWWRGI